MDMTPSIDNRTSPAESRVVRVLWQINPWVALVLAGIIMIMVNYLGNRHYRRWDVSRLRYYQLSEKTHQILGAITNRIQIVAYVQPEHELYEDIRNLLKEFTYYCRRLDVEWVDPERDVARAEEIARKYQADEPNVIIFDAGNNVKHVRVSDLYEMDLSPLQYGRPPRITAFKGESAFSSALQSITSAKRPVVYFLQGHGERDPTDFGRTGGYSEIARLLREDNIDVRTLHLGRTGGRIPEDCDVLIIAGPQTSLAPAEVDAIRSYLQRRGNLLFLSDALTRSGLEPVLASEWDIRLGDDVVVDGTRTLTGRDLIVTEYPPHPITLPLKKLSTVFFLPRSVEPADETEASEADRARVFPLARTSVSGWAETDPTETPLKFDAQTDRPGPVTIAVAAEKGGQARLDLDIRPTRVVVIGDSDFVANGAMSSGNGQFFLNAVNWLAERDNLVNIAPKPVQYFQLLITRRQLQGLFWIVVVAMPGCVAGCGLLVWLRRRK